MMDKDHKIAARLFRDHCMCSEGIFVKDLGLLGRDLNSVVMIDNSATSYKFQPKNGIECVPFIDNKDDRELIEIIPFMEYLEEKYICLGGLDHCCVCARNRRTTKRVRERSMKQRNNGL